MAAWQNDWRLGREFPRFLADLMAAEFARMRPGAPPLRLHDDADLGTDSLEQLRLAMAVSTTLRLGPERLQEMRRFPDWIAECRRVVESPDPGLAFKTSGSSGEPRFVSQPFAALAQEADALAAVLGGATRVVAVVPSHHIYGFLFTILLPQKLGLPVLDARVHAPNTLTALLREGDVVVAFPTFWQAAAESGVCWPGGVVGTTSGAPCPRHIGPALRAQNLSRLVEIYGSTETGGVGWRDDAEKPFRLAPYWRRDGDDRIARDFDCGLTSHELPDVVSWRDAETLVPIRRRDGALQVGGVNVYPDFIRGVLLAHPRIADAAVRLMRPHEGERLKAFIVLKDAAEAPEDFRAELAAWLRQRLTPAQSPRALSFGPRLPLDDRGKPCDWPI